MTVPFIRAEALKALALHQQQKVSQPCDCAVGACMGWDSVSDARWPKTQMQALATLRDPEIAHGQELTFEEYHPDGTRYDSPDAPVATTYFPFNRCDVYGCSKCHRLVLKYTEYGGYYVDPRVRVLRSEFITPEIG
jgi:hypothetical protein